MWESIGMFVSVVTPIAITILVTAVIGWYRVARKKPVSYGTAWAGALSFPIIATSWLMLRPEFWSDKSVGLMGLIVSLGLVTGVCMLPALVIVYICQRRKKHHERHMVEQSRCTEPGDAVAVPKRMPPTPGR